MSTPNQTSVTCRSVTLPDGQVVSVRGAGAMDERDVAALAEVVAAAQRRFAADHGNLAGRVYLEKGLPVTVLTSWGPGKGPRNVRIRRADGTTVVRPFRGLRVPR